MPSIDLGQVVGPTGATGPQGPQGIQGNPGPNQITSSTSTNLSGVLAGSGGVVGVRSVDNTPDSLHTTNLITSAAVADAITGVESDLASIHATGSNNATGAVIPAKAYFYLNGVLVRAKTDIASGAAFTSGTNYEAVTAGGLNDLMSAMLKYISVQIPLSSLGTSWSPTSRYIGTAQNWFGIPGSKIISIAMCGANFSPAANAIISLYNDDIYVAATQETTLSDINSDNRWFNVIYHD